MQPNTSDESAQVMRRYAKVWVALVFLPVAAIVLVGGLILAGVVGEATDSGLLGICGPYGESADLVVGIFILSFPAAIVAGFFSAKYFYRRLTKKPEA